PLDELLPRRERLKRDIMKLLASHPRPFDVEETTRLMGRKTVCAIAEGQHASPRRRPRWWKRLRGRLRRRAWEVEWPRELNPFEVEFMWHAEVMARQFEDPEA